MEIIKPGRQFDFMKHRWKFIGLSVTLLVLSIVSFITPGPTLGTDFKGGTEVEVEFSKGVSTVAIGDAVVKSGFNRPDVVQVADASNANRYLVRVQEVSVLTPAQQTALKTHLCLTEAGATAPPSCPENARASEVKFSPGGEKISLRYDVPPDLAAIAKQLAGIEGVEARDLASPQSNCAAGKSVCSVNERAQSKTDAKATDQHDHKVEIALKSKGDQLLDGLRSGIDPQVKEVRVEWIGPKAGAQLRDAAVKSIAIAIFFIMAYIAIRFDIRFAPGGIVALVHDVGIALGAMVITRREITLSTVAAMLTIVGYSITDTVIVYDRIRENLGKHRTMTFSAVINLSVSEMLGRTLITSGVTSLSLIMFLVWGTGVIKDFAFALLIGIIVGTYSSIYVAAPITEWADRRFFGSSANKPKTVSRQRAAKKADTVV
jgi:preprotein translocase subunit SecF